MIRRILLRIIIIISYNNKNKKNIGRDSLQTRAFQIGIPCKIQVSRKDAFGNRGF